MTFVLNGQGKKIIGSLGKMGLGEYEARAYFTLLLSGESKASAIARMSGVPQPVVYKILESLVDKGVVSVSDGRPKRYRSVELNGLTESFVRSKSDEIDYAIKTEAWLKQVADAFAPIVRKEGNRARFFEPKYSRG